MLDAPVAILLDGLVAVEGMDVEATSLGLDSIIPSTEFPRNRRTTYPIATVVTLRSALAVGVTSTLLGPASSPKALLLSATTIKEGVICTPPAARQYAVPNSTAVLISSPCSAQNVSETDRGGH